MARRLPVLFVVSSLLLAGCGDSGGVDRSQYQSVFDAAMRAVAQRDLAALDPLLSADGRRRLQETLRDFQHRLQDPVQGGLILDLAVEQRGDIDPSEVDAARHGTLEDAWRFLLLSDPRAAVPAKQTPRRLPDGDRVIIEYADPRGTLRTVTLRLREGDWAVDELQL